MISDTPPLSSGEPFMRRPETAKYIESRGIPCSVRTLAKWATVGGGPPYRKFGNKWPLYARRTTDEWIESRLSPEVHSSSEIRRVA